MSSRLNGTLVLFCNYFLPNFTCTGFELGMQKYCESMKGH